MFRTSQLDAIILKTQRLGEMHRNVTLFNPEEGILTATAYGAFKTKTRLRPDTEAFNYIKAYLYFEPVKKSYKITDSECHLTFPAIRQSVAKLFTASLFAEIVLKSFGGGEAKPHIFNLLLDALKHTDQSTEQGLAYLIIQFLWRFLSITGFEPDLDTCALCRHKLSSSEPFYFLLNSALFVCPRCGKSARLELVPGIRYYIIKTEKLSLPEALKIKMEKGATGLLKTVLFNCIQTLLNAELITLKTGEGIL
jgi:DNA repair protein RecO (recombination protein O)